MKTARSNPTLRAPRILLVVAATLISLHRPQPSSAQGPGGPPDSPCGGVLAASADATLDQGQPTANRGTGPIFVGRNAAGEERGLISFDLPPTLLPGATIHNARLELTLLDVAGAGSESYTLDLHSIALNPQPFPPGGTWSEAAVTWNSQPGLGPQLASLTSSTRGGVLSFDITPFVTRALASGGPAGSVPSLSLVLLAGSPGLVALHERLSPAGGPDPDGPRLVIECAPPAPAVPVDQEPGDIAQQSGMDRLRAASQAPVELRLERGAVRFASFDLPVPSAVGRDPLAQAEWLFEDYQELFQRGGTGDSWQLVRRSREGGVQVFRQLHDGIPVFPAELVVLLGDGHILSIGGNYVPGITLPPLPLLDARAAERTALFHRSLAADAGATDPSGGPAAPAVVGVTQLRYVNLALLGEPDESTHLCWLVNVASASSQVGLFVDVRSGVVVHEQRRAADAYDLYLKDRLLHPEIDWVLCWAPGAVQTHDETGPIVSSPPVEATKAFGSIGQVYSYWKTHHGRDSWDNAGVRIEMFVNVNFSQDGGPNANYLDHCRVMQFHPGMATLDVIGHEFAHGVVHHTSNLVYQNQSGALNESFADIFGQLVDSGNWTIGEGSARGAMRDLSHPPAGGDPDHMLASVSGDKVGLRVLPNGVSPDCGPTGNDCGFVHTNSGIHNKAAFLITQGGLHNGRSVAGLGASKSEKLFYQTLLALFGSAQLMDARDRAVWWAAHYAQTSQHGYTKLDACAVRNAYAAVGLGIGDADCDGTLDDVESDQDGDSVPDGNDNCPLVSNPGQANLDKGKDNLGDACDPDVDGDGIYDMAGAMKLDNCRLVWNPGQEDWNGDKVGDACDDSDNDGFVDAIDWCRTVYDPQNRDTDGDKLGDVCDPDLDGDTWPNGSDNCPNRWNKSQLDSDTDTIGDACDLCPGLSNPDNGDPDEDGRGNPCDDDDDNDGFLDGEDNCPLVHNPDQRDDDKNGIGFVCDGAEQIAAVLAHIQRTTLRLENPDPRAGIELLICPSCGGDRYLQDGFVSHVSVQAPVQVRARIVDSQGFTVASTGGGGATQSLTFQPAPFAITRPTAPGAGGGARAAPTEWSEHARTSYFLQLYPDEPVDPDRAYDIAIRIEETVPADDGPAILRGDANGDGGVDIGDAIWTLSYLFSGTRAPPCDDTADANDTGEVDLSDPIFELNFLFLGGPEPPAPGTRFCGPDPTPDPLGCAVVSTHCGS